LPTAAPTKQSILAKPTQPQTIQKTSSLSQQQPPPISKAKSQAPATSLKPSI